MKIKIGIIFLVMIIISIVIIKIDYELNNSIVNRTFYYRKINYVI